MQPNIVLITVDQMRRDCIGLLNNHICETPNLDQMYRDGAIFTRAYSAVPSCIAARAAILTGLTQKSHKRVGYKDAVPWNYEETIASEFTKGGYHTQAVGKMHVYPTRNLCGFHNVVLHDGYLGHSRNQETIGRDSWYNTDDYIPWLRQQLNHDSDIIDSGLQCNSWVARPWPYAEHLHPTNWVVTESIDFLRRRDPSKPFFLMSSFVRPHSPLDPPEVYYNQYINEEFEELPLGDWAEEMPEKDGLKIDAISGQLHKKALHRARAAYYGSITHIDHQIGRLIQVLNEHKILDQTIILFTSDHGDLLGDHNLFRKALPYEGSAGVPFILYDPGHILGDIQNHKIDEPVELRDIMPTLLDIAGISIPENVEGKSVCPLLRYKNPQWREYIHGEHAYGKGSNHYIVTSRYKYIWYSQTGKEQFFDLENDPKELKDLINVPEYEQEINALRVNLIKELEGRQEGYSNGQKLIVGQQAVSVLD